MKGAEYTVDIKPDERELILGTIDLSPDDGRLQGRFPDHHRVRLNRGGDGDDQKFALRRVMGAAFAVGHSACMTSPFARW